MDKEVLAQNQLQLNLDVPYDIRRLEARLKPPHPVIVERLSAVRSHHHDHPTAVEQASFTMLSKDRMAAAQVLARRDLKQQKYLSDARQRLARAVTEASSSSRRPTTPSSEGGFRVSAARVVNAGTARAVNSATAAGRRTPEKFGLAKTAAKASKSEPKRRPSSIKILSTRPAAASPIPTENSKIAQTVLLSSRDAASHRHGYATATSGAGSDVQAASAKANDARGHVTSSQLSALQEHIRTIENELKLLGSWAGKSGRKDEALRRLSESHRGAIQTLQSFASNIPNNKNSEGDAAYKELTAMMGQLSQLCTQLELSGAAPQIKDPQEAAKEELVSAGGVKVPTVIPLTSSGNKTTKKTANGKKARGSTIRLPSERLYPRVKSATTKKAASPSTSIGRSPYATKEAPAIVSPYLTKPVAGLKKVPSGPVNMATDVTSAMMLRTPERRKSTVHFNALKQASNVENELHGSNDESDGAVHPDHPEEDLPQLEDFVQRLMSARQRYTNESAFNHGQHVQEGDADAIDPKWLEETTKAVYLQQSESSTPGVSEPTAKPSAERLSTQASRGSPSRPQQLVPQREQGANSIWEAKDHQLSLRKPSVDSLNAGLARICEEKISNNSEVIAELILSDLMEDTAREMAEREDDAISGGRMQLSSSSSTTLSAQIHDTVGFLDQLLASFDVMQAEQDAMRQRWTSDSLYIRSISPDLPNAADGTIDSAPALVDLGRGDTPSMSSSVSAVNIAQTRDQNGEEVRGLTFIRPSRMAIPPGDQPRGMSEDELQQLQPIVAADAGSDIRSAATLALPLSISRIRLLAIADGVDEYKQYLAQTHQMSTDVFDPQHFMEECAEELQEVCIRAVANEVNKATGDIVDTLYKEEFLSPSNSNTKAECQ